MADSLGETDRTLLIIGSLTVAGVGMLENALKKENSDGTWFFQEIVALNSETQSTTALQDPGARVSRSHNLPAVTQDSHQHEQALKEMFAEMRTTLEDVTHVVFTGLSPNPRDSKYARMILLLCKVYCPNLKYCVSIYSTNSQLDETISLFQSARPESIHPLALLEGLKWAELRYDIMLGVSADHKGYSFEILYALCLYIILSKLKFEMVATAAVPFPEWAAYDTAHSFIDQSHAANVALHVLEDLEGPARYHSTAINIAAANEPLKWRDIWPTICASMNRQSKETIPENEAPLSVNSARALIRTNKDAWNLAFTNDWKRPQARQYPWPSLSEVKFEACWLELLQHRQDTNLDINFLRDIGYYGSRTLEELLIAVKRSIGVMRGHGLLPTEAGSNTEKKHFQETFLMIQHVGNAT